MSNEGTIFVVDDDEAVRDSLDALLRSAGHATSLFANATEFLERVDDEEAGCLLLDVRLPDADGIEILQRLTDDGFDPPVIIITGHGDVPMAVRAMRIGATDFIEKPFEPEELLGSVARALEVRQVHSQSSAQASEAKSRFQRLTPRETDVMMHLVIGQPNKIIAHELGLSPRTVEVHRARVMEKTGAESLSHLVRMAIAAGIDPEVSPPA